MDQHSHAVNKLTAPRWRLPLLAAVVVAGLMATSAPSLAQRNPGRGLTDDISTSPRIASVVRPEG